MPKKFIRHNRTAAYCCAVRNYEVGTVEAQKITDFILSKLRRVKRSSELYVYDCGGIFGHLASRSDSSNGLISFAVYKKFGRVKRLNYRHTPYKKAATPIF